MKSHQRIAQKIIVEQRHDQFFKHHFNHKKTIVGFARNQLAPEILELIDLDTAEKMPDTFLPHRLRGRRAADMMWKFSLKADPTLFVVVHLECQGQCDPLMMVRKLEYHTAVMRVLLEEGHKEIFLIRSFVIYYGKEKWTGPRSIADVFRDAQLYIKEALLAPVIIEVRDIDPEELKKDGQAFPVQMVLARQADHQMVPIIKDVVEALADSPPCCKHETYDYLLDYGESVAKVLQEISSLDPEEAEKFRDMFARSIEETRRVTRRQSLAEGKAEGAAQEKERITSQVTSLDLPPHILSQVMQAIIAKH